MAINTHPSPVTRLAAAYGAFDGRHWLTPLAQREPKPNANTCVFALFVVRFIPLSVLARAGRTKGGRASNKLELRLDSRFHDSSRLIPLCVLARAGLQRPRLRRPQKISSVTAAHRRDLLFKGF